MGDAFMPFRSIDMISSLPQDILLHILVKMPIRDAVKTSVLSSKWRSVWTKIPILDFKEECKHLPSSRLLPIVDNVLLLHDGPTIKAFKLYCLTHSCNSVLKRWIRFLSRKGIECLELEFIENDNPAPFSIFACEELRELTLHCCSLGNIPSAFQGFKCLISLDLKCAQLSEYTINNLLPHCPLLKKLLLEYNVTLGCLKINAPMLKSIKIEGRFEDLVFVNCAVLEDVYIILPQLIYDFGKNKLANTCNLEKTLGCMSSLLYLFINGYFLKFLALGTLKDKLPNSFANLKMLCLTPNFQDRKEIFTAFCIFKSSPNLQKIFIGVYWLPITENDDYFSQEALHCEMHQLKEIEFFLFNGEQPTMEFLKSVLASAPVLESVSITLDYETRKNEANILKSLLSFNRASVFIKKFTVK